MSNKDFVNLCLHLEEYIESPLFDSLEKGKNGYPIGLLKNEFGQIKIHFMHYASFSEARIKWQRRCNRIDYNNIRVVCDAKANIDNEYIKLFASIPYTKILLSSNMPDEYIFCYNMKCYQLEPDLESLVKRRPDGAGIYLDEVDWELFLKG